MKICPGCNEEFLDHIEICPHCQEKLVSEIEAYAIDRSAKKNLLSKEDLLQAETIPLIEGALNHCREIERVLNKAFIPCAVYPLSLAADQGGTLGSANEMKYVLLIKEGDLEQAKAALDGKFYDEVAKEGKGNFVTEVIDLSQAEITCPACQEIGPLVNGECANCGLYLDAVDPTGQKSH